MKPIHCLGWCLYLALLTIAPPASAAAPVEEITALRSEIARHDDLYHRKAAPAISDADYDALRRTLAELERAHPEAAKSAPPLRAIADDRTGLFQTRQHREPMLSLEKAYNEAELRAFHARVAEKIGHDHPAYSIEPKYDGLAVSVAYEHGKLVRAVTRGNGVEGDDITLNVLRVSDVPRELGLPAAPAGGPVSRPELVELRGEIHITFDEFERINAAREIAGEPPFANPRNLAAGTVRQLDSDVVAQRGLRVVFFGIGACEPATILPATQSELLAQLRGWGVPIIEEMRTASGADELVRAVEAMRRARSGFAFPTDGVVVKLDSLSAQRGLGSGESAPRWSVAYKYASERVETRLRAITIQVGRSGVLTPVAELVPVKLGGSTIARATLHNRDEIARKDIRIGDYVYVEKSGDVIPAIVGVNQERRSPDAQPYVFPDECPDCRSKAAARAGEVAVRCSNEVCPAQLRRRIEHFASKACVDIEGLGPATIEALVAGGSVKDIPDIYRVGRAEWLALDGVGGKSAERLMAAIERSKTTELWRVIHGIGIPQVGVATSKELARKHGTLEAFATAEIEPRYRALVVTLIEAGVRVAPAASAAGARKLAGKRFVLTGTLPTLTRAEAIERIEAAGGIVRSNVSRATDYVVAGSEAGAKLERARDLGITVLDEVALKRLMAGD